MNTHSATPIAFVNIPSDMLTVLYTTYINPSSTSFTHIINRLHGLSDTLVAVRGRLVLANAQTALNGLECKKDTQDFKLHETSALSRTLALAKLNLQTILSDTIHLQQKMFDAPLELFLSNSTCKERESTFICTADTQKIKEQDPQESSNTHFYNNTTILSFAQGNQKYMSSTLEELSRKLVEHNSRIQTLLRELEDEHRRKHETETQLLRTSLLIKLEERVKKLSEQQILLPQPVSDIKMITLSSYPRNSLDTSTNTFIPSKNSSRTFIIGGPMTTVCLVLLYLIF